ncbi:MAG: DEAD/DEAH box helicase [Salinarchaeum sp.]
MTDDGDTGATEEIGATMDLDVDAVTEALQSLGRPIATASDLARELERSQAAVETAIAPLVEAGEIERLDVETDPVVYYPGTVDDLARTERVVPFPDRREIVIDHPTQFTRARCAQFARLVTVEDGRYLYTIRAEDIWGAPYESVDRLLETIRGVLPERAPRLEEWVIDQWTRAGKFRLVTHEDGYVVLRAESESLMADVARTKLEEGHLRAPISETEAWVAEEAIATIKRTLYEAGYPVRDDRELEHGEPLELSVSLELRDYQRDWVERFEEAGSGVLVGPPGSGKTVAAMAIMAAVGGETLILVPSRQLATQWRTELLANTTLKESQVGEYHGGRKQRRPVTIATYQIAGMDRHRDLFDAREWGLIVYDECQHIPSPIARRSARLQSKARLGTTGSPVREDDKETDIYTLIGPPIGTDWEALFEAGYVAEPEIELRYLPWDSETARNEYVAAEGHDRRRLAATNPAKVPQVQALVEATSPAKTLVFVDYLEQGDAIANALGVPFLSGETPHARRERHLGAFRSGQLETLVVSRVGDEGIDLPEAEVAIIASGLGGSRRQGAQRAGRTMRPAGKAQVYVLATKGTDEEEFARRRTRFLAGKGVRISEQALEAPDEV